MRTNKNKIIKSKIKENNLLSIKEDKGQRIKKNKQTIKSKKYIYCFFIFKLLLDSFAHLPSLFPHVVKYVFFKMRKLWTPIRRPEEEKIIKNNFDEEKKEDFENSLPCGFIEENRKKRNSFFEIKESTLVEQKEHKEVQKILAHEMRDKCRAEIDEYVDCTVGRLWTVLKCKELMKKMRACLKKYENLEYVKFREKQIMEERKKNGTSIMRSDERAKYNRFINPDNGRGWVPVKEINKRSEEFS